MQKDNLLKTGLTCLLALISFISFSQSPEGAKKVNTKREVKGFIDHHLQDSHSFVFFSDGETGEHYGFPLPVILWDKGLKVFSSGDFEHGAKLVEKDGDYYKLYHNKIYKTDAEGTITYGENGFPDNVRPLDFSITKNVMMMLFVSIVLLLIFTALASGYKKRNVPTGFSRFMEPMVLYVRDEIAEPNIGPKYKKYMSFLLTIFFFILILNLAGMTPLGVNVTGNIAVTMALALVTFFIVQFSGNKHYWGHIFWMPGVPIPMKIILIPIELLGMITKPFALMIRLFANMTAGHVIVMTLLGLIVVFQNWIAGPAFFGFTIFISVIELLVAFLQAYIFTLLSALYIGMAVEEHPEHPNDHNDEAAVI